MFGDVVCVLSCEVLNLFPMGVLHALEHCCGIIHWVAD